jgi:hypothetical protein
MLLIELQEKKILVLLSKQLVRGSQHLGDVARAYLVTTSGRSLLILQGHARVQLGTQVISPNNSHDFLFLLCTLP